MSRIDVPRNTIELVDLARRINKKHVADGDKSPLNLLEEVNWTELSSNADKTEEIHRRAEELMRQVDQLYKERDLLLLPIGDGIKKTRNFLKNLYPSNPKKLGEWGMDVVD